MQLNLLSRLKGFRLSAAAAYSLLALLFAAFCGYALFSAPQGEAAAERSVSAQRLMTGENGITDPLEYTELMPGMTVNINTAGPYALSLLPGIGEKRAEAIIAYREEHGGFTSAEELKNIYGIGEGIYEKIRELITVGDS